MSPQPHLQPFLRPFSMRARARKQHALMMPLHDGSAAATQLLNFPETRMYIAAEDERALGHCTALDVFESDDIKSGFTIVMVRGSRW